MDASQYLPLLRKHLGEDGFKYLNPLKSAAYADNDHDDILLTMEELVTKMKKNDLISFSVMMGFEVDAGQDIDEMRKHYIEEVKKHSKRILMLLPENEIFILKEIRNDSSKLYDGVRIPFDYSYTILERLGLGEGDWDELGYYYLYVAEDFAELVMPLLDEVDKDEGYRAKSLIVTGRGETSAERNFQHRRRKGWCTMRRGFFYIVADAHHAFFLWQKQRNQRHNTR